MSPKQKRRLLAISLIVLGAVTATALALYALSGNVSYLYSPTAVREEGLEPGARFRLGGVVLEESIQRLGGLKVGFTVTDRVNEHAVFYEGILPDLFREGQSVIAHGHLREDGLFEANKVLAKHDETYMPKEVMDAMERARGDGASPAKAY
ncbi:MAG: cytochrome c maturation protein CcmE [Pseudoxanthomonas sp.]|nr:cytochrome c maturation protein CcmE [Pseudoxanthomonas sp.]